MRLRPVRRLVYIDRDTSGNAGARKHDIQYERSKARARVGRQNLQRTKADNARTIVENIEHCADRIVETSDVYDNSGTIASEPSDGSRRDGVDGGLQVEYVGGEIGN